jgi:GNAT superfamily N-acetyltransferase
MLLDSYANPFQEVIMSDVKIVKAELSMVPALLPLCKQLGYELSADEVSAQLQKILSRPDHLLLAALLDGEVHGWAHFYVVDLIISLPYVEVGGIVVDEACRKQGLGQALLQEGEHWTMENGMDEIRLRSGIQRAEAHAFYERVGYTCIKHQKTFLKNLPVMP